MDMERLFLSINIIDRSGNNSTENHWNLQGTDGAVYAQQVSLEGVQLESRRIRD